MEIQIQENEIKVTSGFNQLKQKKITGTRLATILGLNKFNSPFSAWTEMIGLYKPVIPDQYFHNVEQPFSYFILLRFSINSSDVSSNLVSFRSSLCICSL